MILDVRAAQFQSVNGEWLPYFSFFSIRHRFQDHPEHVDIKGQKYQYGRKATTAVASSHHFGYSKW
jgi:hypothetical protein